ncbi:MAG: tetratricopeptide repeat protein [Desulfobacterales bacterium]|jgi:hypothetical protein
MSVIFETLKKLKTESADQGKSTKKSVHRKRVYSFKTALNSPLSVFLLLFGFIIIGAGTLYGYFQFRDATGEIIKDFSISNTEIHRSTDVRSDRSIENKGKGSLNGAKFSDSIQIEYRPSEVENHTIKTFKISKPDNVRTPLVAAKEKFSDAKESLKKDAIDETKTEKTGKPSSGLALPVSGIEKIFLVNAKKNAKIARLVADIRWEMSNGNKTRTEKLLDELSLIKGHNNSYVLKLKAVCHIRNQEYERATDLLKIILTKNESDLEAGINMAIVEINTQQEKKAYRRLEKLQSIYPEHIRLAEIMQNLRLWLNKDQIRPFGRHNG